MRNHEGHDIHEGHESKKGFFVFFVFVVFFVVAPQAQQLLDRIVARVNGYAITLTDVKAAVALGIVRAAGADDNATIESLVDRQLMLAEVARFVPPEPPAAAIEKEVAAIKARVGERLSAVMESSGLDEGRIREIARENLRIEEYLDQRFGTSVQLTEDEVERYYRIHPEVFTRNGTLMPFVEAEPTARQRAAAERRSVTVAQWLRDLRSRAEITKPAGSRQ
jgi:hypothetical protein